MTPIADNAGPFMALDPAAFDVAAAELAECAYVEATIRNRSCAWLAM